MSSQKKVILGIVLGLLFGSSFALGQAGIPKVIGWSAVNGTAGLAWGSTASMSVNNSVITTDASGLFMRGSAGKGVTIWEDDTGSAFLSLSDVSVNIGATGANGATIGLDGVLGYVALSPDPDAYLIVGDAGGTVSAKIRFSGDFGGVFEDTNGNDLVSIIDGGTHGDIRLENGGQIVWQADAPAADKASIDGSGNELDFNVATAKPYLFLINNVEEYRLDATQMLLAAGNVLRFGDSNVEISETGTNDLSLKADNTIVLALTGAGVNVTGNAGATGYVQGLGIIMTSGAEPSCAAGIRGEMWYVAGGGGAADTAKVCLKNAADVYAWAPFAAGYAGSIGGSTGTTDNAALRADGTGTATLQASDIIIGDTASNLTTISNLGANIIEIRGDRAETSSVGAVRIAAGDDYATNGLVFEWGDAADTTYSRKGGVTFSGVILGGRSGGTARTPASTGLITTAVSNTTAGPDDLQSYAGYTSALTPTTPAGIGRPALRATATGSVANNSETKTLICYYGSQAVLTNVMSTTSGANNWRVVFEIWSTGTNTQDYDAVFTGNVGAAAAFVYDQEFGTATQTDSSANAIKCTGTAATAGSITMERLFVESL